MIQTAYLPLLRGSAQMEVVDEQPPDRTGLLLGGRYRIQAPLGLGAMACVYSGVDERTGLQVAIKILKEEVRDRSTYAERFEREVLITSRLNHSCCIRIQDCGHTDEGLPYQVMELVRGRPLADVLDVEERFEEVRALGIMRQLLSALAHCAEAGVIHRDVKPENILLYSEVGREDSLKLIDFGIAKLIGEAAQGQEALTSVGLILGTPHYIAPDWVTCDKVDGRADLYSASVMLFEMLCSAPPFLSEDRRALMRMHLKEKPPSLASRMPGVEFSPGLEDMIMKGLAKDPKDRFRDANEYLQALEKVFANHVSVAPSVGSSPVPLPSPSSPALQTANPVANPLASNPPAGTPPMGAALARPQTGAPVPTLAHSTGQSFDSVPNIRPKSNRGLLVFVVIMALGVIGGGGYLLTRKDSASTSATRLQADASSTLVDAAPAPVADAGPSSSDAAEPEDAGSAEPEVVDAGQPKPEPDAGGDNKVEDKAAKIRSSDMEPALKAWKKAHLKVRGFRNDMADDMAKGQCRAGRVEGIRTFLCLADIDPVKSSKPVKRVFTGESKPRRFRARIRRGELHLRVEDIQAKKRKRYRRKIESVFSKLKK